MPVHHHDKASTTVCQRERIRSSHLTDPSFSPEQAAKELCTSRQTVYKWADRADPNNRASGRSKGSGRVEWDEEIWEAVLYYRSYGRSVHETAEALKMDGLNKVPSAATIHRRLAERGLSCLVGKDHLLVQDFEETPVGYLHIDLFYLPDIFGGRRYCMVVIERATRMLYTEIVPDRTEDTVTKAFLRALAFYPCHVHTVLSDNGSEFGGVGKKETDEAPPKKKDNKEETTLKFDEVCGNRFIKHRRTKPATPKTNGMAERMVAQAKKGTELALPETWITLCPSPTLLQSADAERTHVVLPRNQRLPKPVTEHLRHWTIFWNEVKPLRVLAWRTPLEAMQALYNDDPTCFHRPPKSTINHLAHLNNLLGGQRFLFSHILPPLKRNLCQQVRET